MKWEDQEQAISPFNCFVARFSLDGTGIQEIEKKLRTFIRRVPLLYCIFLLLQLSSRYTLDSNTAIDITSIVRTWTFLLLSYKLWQSSYLTERTDQAEEKGKTSQEKRLHAKLRTKEEGHVQRKSRSARSEGTIMCVFNGRRQTKSVTEANERLL